MCPRSLLIVAYMGGVVENVKNFAIAIDLLLCIIKTISLVKEWPTITILLLVVGLIVNTTSFALYLHRSAFVAFVWSHQLLAPLLYINITTASLSFIICILGGMCKMLLLDPCTTLRLSRWNHRLPVVVAIVRRAIIVHVTVISTDQAKCWRQWGSHCLIEIVAPWFFPMNWSILLPNPLPSHVG